MSKRDGRRGDFRERGLFCLGSKWGVIDRRLIHPRTLVTRVAHGTNGIRVVPSDGDFLFFCTTTLRISSSETAQQTDLKFGSQDNTSRVPTLCVNTWPTFQEHNDKVLSADALN